MNSLTLIVSRPSPALRSNGGHGNRYETARARKIAKAEAWALTLQSPGLAVADGDIVCIQFTELLGPYQRAMDDDNLIGGMKAARDGIAQALEIDDKCILTQPRLPAERGTRNAVRVKL